MFAGPGRELGMAWPDLTGCREPSYCRRSARVSLGYAMEQADFRHGSVSQRTVARRSLASRLESVAELGAFFPKTAVVIIEEPRSLFVAKAASESSEPRRPLTAMNPGFRQNPVLFRRYLTYMHEVFHWFQHLALPYEHFGVMTDSFICQVGVVTCKRFAENWPTVTVQKPLLGWLSRSFRELLSGAKRRPHMDYLREQVSLATAAQDTWDYVEGTLIEASPKAAERMSVRAGGYVDPHDCMRYWLSMAEAEALAPCNTSPIGQDGGPIGGLALLEGQARALEEILRIREKTSGSAVVEELFPQTAWYGDYSRALDLMLSRRSLTRQSHLPEEKWLELLVEFCAHCDLALCTPLAPSYRHLWRGSMLWRDFHPGWRFTKLLDVTGRLSINWLAGDINPAYSAFCEEACDILGWPKPQDFAGVAFGDKRAVHFRVAEKAMEFRLQHPGMLVRFASTTCAGEEAWKALFYDDCPLPLISDSHGKDVGTMVPSVAEAPAWFTPDDSGMPSGEQYIFFFGFAATIYDLGCQLAFREGPFRVGVRAFPHDQESLAKALRYLGFTAVHIGQPQS